MQDFMRTVYRQMRLASSLRSSITLSMLLIACTAGAALWRWSEGEVKHWRGGGRPPPWRCG